MSFVDGSDSNTDNSRFMEKLKAMDSHIISLKEDMHEMRKNYNNRGCDHASKNDDTPMCERHEANYIQSIVYQNQDSHDSYSRQSYYDPNVSKKLLTELNNDVKNDLEDFIRRTPKLQNDILMFQQHQGESLFKTWTSFKDLLTKVPHYGIDLWLQIKIFYDHVSFHLKSEIDCAAGGKLHDKNGKESWEIIENLTLYDHKGSSDLKEKNQLR
nr:zinc finger, CCHC-type [Tanacetum cinerariifolium]